MSSAIRIDSAGLVGAGRSPPLEAVRVAARYGVALSTHRAKPLTREVVAGADLLMVMDPVHRRRIRERFAGVNRAVVILGDLDPQWIDGRVIPDPAGYPEEAFERTYAQIARCVRALALVIGKRSPVPANASSQSP